MTQQERAALEQAAPHAPLLWEEMPGSGFVRLLTPGGCPFLTIEDGIAACAVYAVRPFNCRRFMCGRVDTVAEPYEAGGPLGCLNLSDRLEQSLDAQAAYATRQRLAYREWGHAHGWRLEPV
jgi:Fe-S-cluster containining protein